MNPDSRGPGDEELLTARLVLRRPAPQDTGAIFAIHSDPRTYVHNPSDAVSSLEEAGQLFGRWDGHWRRFGFGYWVVRWRDATAPVGFCGVKVMRFGDQQVLNLFTALTRACGAMAWAARRPQPLSPGPPGGIRSTR